MIESERGQERMLKVAKLKNIADELAVNMAQLSIAWCLLNSNVSSVILGASSKIQLIENINSIKIVPKIDDEVNKKLRLI